MNVEKRGLLKDSFWMAISGLLLFSLFYFGYATFHTDQIVSGSPPLLLSQETGNDLQKTFRKAISDAKESVWLSIYTLKDPAILHALNKKAKEGVSVHVISDSKASGALLKTLGRQIKLTLRSGKGIMHHKILVIDSRNIWLGSANMTTSSLKMHGNLVMGIESLELGEKIIEKLTKLSNEGFTYPVLKELATVSDQKMELWFLPDNAKAHEKVKNLIRSAKKTIKVAMFTWTRFDFAEELSEANERGVKTEVVLDRSASLKTNTKIVEALFKANIPVRLSEGNGLLHHKMMIIDDTILLNGSANWTYSAFQKNEDYFAVLYDLNEDQRRLLNLLWKEIMRDSKPVEESLILNR